MVRIRRKLIAEFDQEDYFDLERMKRLIDNKNADYTLINIYDVLDIVNRCLHEDCRFEEE